MVLFDLPRATAEQISSFSPLNVKQSTRHLLSKEFPLHEWTDITKPPEDNNLLCLLLSVRRHL